MYNSVPKVQAVISNTSNVLYWSFLALLVVTIYFYGVWNFLLQSSVRKYIFFSFQSKG